MIPDLSAETTQPAALPLGRFGCSIDEVESRFVSHADFSASATRRDLFDDLLAAKAMLDRLGPDLIECAWLGGSFVTAKMDPDDVDCMFMLSGEAFEGLPSNGARTRVLEFNKKGRLREKTGLRVEAFIFVRHAHPMPWYKGGVDPAFLDEFSIRGAWDDWWLRVRLGDKDSAPTAEEARPVRGYLEVRWS